MNGFMESVYFGIFFFRSKVEALFEFICQKKYKNKNQKRAKTLGFYFFVECIERIDTQHFCIDTYWKYQNIDTLQYSGINIQHY